MIIKLVSGTHGEGVVLAETNETAGSVIDAFRNLNAHFLVQEFVREARGQDVRCLVIGHEVVAATDGPGALTKLGGASRFELMISDLKMPKMTGTELLAEVKKIRPELPVVLMTAFATVSTAVVLYPALSITVLQTS